jgi:hypothetical protein
MGFSQKPKFWESLLFEVRRPPFKALAFLTFRHGFDLAVLKNGLYLDLATAGTEEFLGCAGGPRVFTGYSHSFSPCRQAFTFHQQDTTEWILSQGIAGIFTAKNKAHEGKGANSDAEGFFYNSKAVRCSRIDKF